ncbi:hypothetical protein Q5P01_001483 [Channa striata]|uniref:Migration and invasion inhibitory protein n=1 Tax=Channa striata TaxID=64152 RepID=A0AA88TCJ7_CHASR|nr:hypothetical protein Q5P01_001483 [Channa striata]
MSSADRQEALRERCKDLLKQLRRQRENLEWLSGLNQSRKREREDGAEGRRQPAEIVTLTDGDRGPARAALAKPTVKFADTHQRQTSGRRTSSSSSFAFKNSRGNNQNQSSSDIFIDSDRHPGVEGQQKDTRPLSTRSCLRNNVKEQREVQSRVTFQSDECQAIPASDRHQLQPLLGYDWIAGVLDAENSLTERSDEFFDELCMFRALNKDKCIHNPQAEFSQENHLGTELLADKGKQEANTDTHQCVFSYRINSRLFPVPLKFQECCSVCNKDKFSHPHTTAEPASIRVSIPCSTLMPSYEYKAHRRCSFDPSDSLGLPSHCLSGWSNTGQIALPPSRNLDLQSSLNIKSSTSSQKKEAEDLPMSKNRISNQFTDVSRLAHHNFQHFSPKRRLGSTSNPVC